MARARAAAIGAGHPFVSVVIPHLNQLDALERCLLSLRRQSYPADRFEIILVDNGSSADLTDLQARHERLRIFREPRPGPGLARNRGVEAATGEILAFIDADCRAAESWIAAGVAALAEAGSTGVVGGDVRIDFVDPARLSALEAYEAVFAFRQKLYISQHHYSGSGNLVMRRDVFRTVGGFAGIDIAEDVDWGRRARAAGYPARYHPEMMIFHPARSSFAELQAKWRRHIAHQLASHRAEGRSPLAWRARAGAVIVSALPHGIKLLTSDRLRGIRARMAGLRILYRVRWFRFREMLNQIGHGSASSAAGWNRPGHEPSSR